MHETIISLCIFDETKSDMRLISETNLDKQFKKTIRWRNFMIC